MNNVIIWDIETIPDLNGFTAANGHDGKTDENIRAALGDKISTIRSSALVPWLLTGKMAAGRSMHLGRRMWESGPRKL